MARDHDGLAVCVRDFVGICKGILDSCPVEDADAGKGLHTFEVDYSVCVLHILSCSH